MDGVLGSGRWPDPALTFGSPLGSKPAEGSVLCFILLSLSVILLFKTEQVSVPTQGAAELRPSSLVPLLSNPGALSLRRGWEVVASAEQVVDQVR